MKKIVHIENSTHLTGAFKALLGICAEIRQHYTSIVALPAQSSCDAILQEKGIRWVKFPFHELRKSIRAFLLYVPYLVLNTIRLVRYVRRNKVDVLHANDHFNLVPVLAKAILGRRVKLVVHVRLLPSTYNHQLFAVFRKLNTRYADKLIAVSHAIYESYNRPARMEVIRDRIVLKEGAPAYVPKEGAAFRFVYISNYIQGKGQNFAVEAFIRVAPAYPQAELHFYGGVMGLQKNEQFKADLAAKVRQAGFESRVFFHDFAADTEKVYKAHDASLCFSESESFSLICIESQFYGVPVIASESGGPQEIIRHGESGLLVPNRDVEEMAAAMRQLMDNFALRKTLSAGGKVRVQELLNSTPSFLSVLARL